MEIGQEKKNANIRGKEHKEKEKNEVGEKEKGKEKEENMRMTHIKR